MIKLFLVFLSMIAGTMIGYFFYKGGKSREKYFESLVSLCNSLMSDIRFSCTSLSELLVKFKADNKTILNSHIEEYLKFIDSKEEAKFNLSKSVLKEGEKQDVLRFFSILGTSDSSTQLFELENYKIKFDDYYKRALEKNTRYGKNYIKLGFLFGLALGILLI